MLTHCELLFHEKEKGPTAGAPSGKAWQYMGGFSKIRGNFLGVPIIRTIVYWGLYWKLCTERRAAEEAQHLGHLPHLNMSEGPCPSKNILNSTLNPKP